MMHNKNFQKIINLILCFVILFNLGTTVSYAEDKQLKETNFLLRQLTDVFLAFGDGVLHIVSSSVGEMVTIDRLVFNKVNKVSIDYWDDMPSDGTSTQEPVKAFMQPVINKWYPVFFKIATMVYMIVLVYIGIATMLASTAEKKASYKQLFTTWFIGITILFMFPYVMKYIIIINNAFVSTLDETAYSEEGATKDLVENDFGIAFKYGTTAFEEHLGTEEEAKGDILVLTRKAALNQKFFGLVKQRDISLAIMYIILLGQMIAILIMYYKRAFMIAFLITIFPLVAMTYVIDKIGDGKNQTFGTWFKEFVVNVIVQMFHAVVYVIVTGAGIKLYLETNGGYFIFTILCIFFLFEGEKILRTIFNVNSKANTIGNIAASGAVALGVVTNGFGLIKKSGDGGTEEDKKSISEANKRLKTGYNREKANNTAAIEALNEKKERGESTVSHGEYQGSDKEPDGVSTPQYDGQKARDTLLGTAMQRRLKRGIASGTVNFAFGATGATLEMSRKMADGSTGVGEAVAAVSVGKSAGEFVGKPLTFGINKLEQLHHGNRVAKQIESGVMDKELGINNIPNTYLPTLGQLRGNADANISQADIEKRMDNQKEIYREALARYEKVAARRGDVAAQIAYYEYLESNLEK